LEKKNEEQEIFKRNAFATSVRWGNLTEEGENEYRKLEESVERRGGKWSIHREGETRKPKDI